MSRHLKRSASHDNPKRLLFLRIISFCIIILTACTSRQDERLLMEAEQYLPNHPDSALLLVDSVTPHIYARYPWDEDDAIVAHYALVHAYAHALIHHEVNSDTLLRYAYHYYQGRNTDVIPTDSIQKSRYALSCYLMGRFYASLDSVKACEMLYQQAINSARQCRSWRTAYLASDHLSQQKQQSNPREAVNLSLQSLHFFEKAEMEEPNYVGILTRIGNNYTYANQLDSALWYIDRALELSTQFNLPAQKSDALRSKAVVSYYMKDYPRALELTKQGMTHVEKNVQFNATMLLASCYQALDSLDQAKQVLLALAKGQKASNRYFVYKNLYQIASMENDLSAMQLYADSVTHAMEEMYIQSLQNKEAYYSDLVRKESSLKEVQVTAQRNFWLFLTICITSTLLLIILVLSVLIVKNRLQLLREQHVKEKELAKNRNEQQKQLIQEKQNAMMIMREYIFDHNKTVSSLKSGDITQSVNWKKIETMLNMTDDHFVNRLKATYPNLSEESIQLCMLSRLKIPNSSIAGLFEITTGAVKKRKQQLKKILFNVFDSPVSLEQLLETF